MGRRGPRLATRRRPRHPRSRSSVSDSIAGFCDRTPALRDALTLTSSTVEATATGARLDVLPADAASSWGLNPHAVFVDEIAQWSDTPGPRRLWESVSSAAAKRTDARLIVLSTAGDPAHFSRRILDHALTSPLWRVHEVPGPTPWMAEDRLDEQKARLSEAMFARLFLNVWTAGEDRLATADELRDCVTLDGPLDYNPAHRYHLALDLGLKRDRTVAVVAHREDRRVVLDRIGVWQGTRAAPVALEDVEAWIVQTSLAFRSAKVIADPWQAVGMLQRLRSRGLAVEEYAFTAASVGRLAASLFNAIRDRAVALPPDEDLLDELAHVRLRESSPGVFRLDHDSGRHDDRAVALALAVTTLLQEVQAPAGLSDQIAEAKERMARAAASRSRSGSTEERFAAEHVPTELLWSTGPKPEKVVSDDEIRRSAGGQYEP